MLFFENNKQNFEIKKLFPIANFNDSKMLFTCLTINLKLYSHLKPRQ